MSRTEHKPTPEEPRYRIEAYKDDERVSYLFDDYTREGMLLICRMYGSMSMYISLNHYERVSVTEVIHE